MVAAEPLNGTGLRVALIAADDAAAAPLAELVARAFAEARVVHGVNPYAALGNGHGGADLVFFVATEAAGQPMQALKQAMEMAPDAAFVSICADDAETVAAESLRAGVHECLFRKDLSEETLRRSSRFAMERRDMLKLLREDQLRYRLLAENSTDMISLQDADGTCRYMSPASTTVLGVSPDKMVGGQMYDFYHPEDAQRIQKEFSGSRSTVRHAVHRMRRSDGTFGWFETLGHAIRDKSRAVGDYVSISRDITQRKEAEDKTKRNMEWLEATRSIDRAISSSLDLRVTLGILIDKAMKLLGVDAVSILLYNPDSQLLQFAMGSGFKTSIFQYTLLRLGESYAGKAALQQRMVRVSNPSDLTTEFAQFMHHRDEEFVDYLAAPMITKGEVKGVLELFHRKPMIASQDWLQFLETLCNQAAIAIDSAGFFDRMRQSNRELVVAVDATLEGWARALELRDIETHGHTRRVTDLTVRLAREMGFNNEQLVHVRHGAILHDIGKMGIPDSILLKPGKLDESEWNVMRRHPVYAFKLLKPISFLQPALSIPYAHHEKWDGSGYPRGLVGEEIPIAARIFAVVDVWDALTSDRPYRKGWAFDKVKEHVLEGRGTHFDPRAVDVFIEMMEKDPMLGGGGVEGGHGDGAALNNLEDGRTIGFSDV